MRHIVGAHPVAAILAATVLVLAVLAPAASATSNFYGNGRGIDAPKVIWPGEKVLIVATSLRPDRYVARLVRNIPARHLACSVRVARSRRASGTERFYGQIPRRFRCYSTVKKAYVAPVPVSPGYAKFWVAPVRRTDLTHGPSLRFQTTTVAATPRFAG